MTTQAQRAVARYLSPPAPVRVIEDACLDAGSKVRHTAVITVRRHEFRDGSSVLVGPGWWDFGRRWA